MRVGGCKLQKKKNEAIDKHVFNYQSDRGLASTIPGGLLAIAKVDDQPYQAVAQFKTRPQGPLRPDYQCKYLNVFLMLGSVIVLLGDKDALCEIRISAWGLRA